jgi:predicted GNAT family acetyltransferase
MFSKPTDFQYITRNQKQFSILHANVPQSASGVRGADQSLAPSKVLKGDEQIVG